MFDNAKRAIERRRKRVKVRERQLAGARRKLEQAKQNLKQLRAAEAEAAKFCYSRGLTNHIIKIVDGRAVAGSRKRAANDPLSLANPGSDHNCANKCADAVDFKIANAFSLADEISRRLGGPADIVDGQKFNVKFNGRLFRVQIIAGTHGTGPHLHVGVVRL